jgi:hypothetical protein
MSAERASAERASVERAWRYQALIRLGVTLITCG